MRCIVATSLFSAAVGNVLWEAEDLKPAFGFAVTSQTVAIIHHFCVYVDSFILLFIVRCSMPTSVSALGPAVLAIPFWLDFLLTLAETAGALTAYCTGVALH